MAKQSEQVQEIPISELFPFKDHPFRVLDDEAMQRTVESISQFGVLAPAIARPRPEGGYEIIAGHRRLHASQLLGLETMPVLVRQMDDDTAIITMVDSNLQRETMLPSERARAYKMKMDAMARRAGRPSKENSGQLDRNFLGKETREIIAEQTGESARQVQRYVNLTNLIPELMEIQQYNRKLFQTRQEGIKGLESLEESCFQLSDYGITGEVFGVLSIPALDLEMPVYLGASSQNMALGAAQLGQTSVPVGGKNTNTVIAGHRGWNGADYFRYITELVPGDRITITNLWETLEYAVVGTRIISPDDVDAIKIQPEKDMITLFTCHPYASGGRQRYLVFCERINNEIRKDDSK